MASEWGRRLLLVAAAVCVALAFGSGDARADGAPPRPCDRRAAGERCFEYWERGVCVLDTACTHAPADRAPACMRCVLDPDPVLPDDETVASAPAPAGTEPAPPAVAPLAPPARRGVLVPSIALALTIAAACAATGAVILRRRRRGHDG